MTKEQTWKLLKIERACENCANRPTGTVELSGKTSTWCNMKRGYLTANRGADDPMCYNLEYWKYDKNA